MPNAIIDLNHAYMIPLVTAQEDYRTILSGASLHLHQHTLQQVRYGDGIPVVLRKILDR